MSSADLDKLIKITKINRIAASGGDVLHYLKSSENSFIEFGEAYFSLVDKNVVKGWKYHKKMTMNICVPVGTVQFVFTDIKQENFRSIIIGESDHSRLTVQPFTVFAFKGLSDGINLVANISNIEHDPDESVKISEDKIQYEW